eukprot:PLAT10983.1.p1 GENE.PLAT10983.1~~PLAT10983.1.p1  ORF type:complete len:1007 (+),score=498.63 PLAT10983.1:33-3023(+)
MEGQVISYRWGRWERLDALTGQLVDGLFGGSTSSAAVVDGQLRPLTESTAEGATPGPLDAMEDEDGVLDGMRLRCVALGRQHALLLSEDGHVYSCGSGQQGALGCGHVLDSLSPQLVAPLLKPVVTLVAAGAAHSAAITESGDVYTWGRGLEGQLGHGPLAVLPTPRFLAAFHGRRMLKVACGDAHTLFLGEDGQLHGCGSAQLGQLGCDRCTLQARPIRILLGGEASAVEGEEKEGGVDDAVEAEAEADEGEEAKEEAKEDSGSTEGKTAEDTTAVRVIDVAAGWGHSLAVAEDGSLFAWGSNVRGELGIASRQSVCTPTRVAWPSGEALPVAVFANAHRSFAVTAPGAVWAWGCNERAQLPVETAEAIVDVPTAVRGPCAGQQVMLAAFSHGEAYFFCPTRVAHFTPSMIPASGAAQLRVAMQPGWTADGAAVRLQSAVSGEVASAEAVWHDADGGSGGGDDDADGSTGFLLATVPSLPEGEVHIDATLGGHFYAPAARPLLVYKEPLLSAVTPAQGPLRGGTSIVVAATQLCASTTARLRFSTPDWLAEVAADVDVERGVVCARTPAGAAAGAVRLQLLLNGQDAGSSSVQFAYYDLRITSLTPSSAAVTGGREVIVTVDGMPHSGEALLSVTLPAAGGRQLRVEGERVSDSELRFITPALAGKEEEGEEEGEGDEEAGKEEDADGATGKEEEEEDDDDGKAAEDGKRRDTPAVVHAATLGISFNDGADFTTAPQPFHLYHTAVQPAEPACAPVAGGTKLRIAGGSDGAGFFPSPAARLRLRGRFFHAEVAAVYDDDSRCLLATAPAYEKQDLTAVEAGASSKRDEDDGKEGDAAGADGGKEGEAREAAAADKEGKDAAGHEGEQEEEAEDTMAVQLSVALNGVDFEDCGMLQYYAAVEVEGASWSKSDAARITIKGSGFFASSAIVVRLTTTEEDEPFEPRVQPAEYDADAGVLRTEAPEEAIDLHLSAAIAMDGQHFTEPTNRFTVKKRIK